MKIVLLRQNNKRGSLYWGMEQFAGSYAAGLLCSQEHIGNAYKSHGFAHRVAREHNLFEHHAVRVARPQRAAGRQLRWAAVGRNLQPQDKAIIERC